MESKDLVRLEVLRRKNAASSWKNGELYRLLFKPDLYVVAYERLKSNPGSMTPGTDGSTIDGFSMSIIESIIKAMREESFTFSRARRVSIPKPNGGERKLAVAPARDKVVQEVIRMILEAIYDSPHGATFSEHSHGFRPGRGCHSALKEVRTKWSGVTWIIEGDVKAAFDSIDHGRLIGVLRKRITDERFLNLIQKALSAGYYEFGTPVNAVIGTPQGSVLSPILANIFLHEFDEFVQRVMYRETKGENKPLDLEYRRAGYRLEALRKQVAKADGAERQTLIEQIRECKKKLICMPVYRDDGTFVRVKYVRYADDWCVGVNGPRELAESLRNEIGDFLKNELGLTLSVGKTHIRHAKTEEAFFLGTRFTIGSASPKVSSTTRGGRTFSKRVAGWSPRMFAPVDRIVKRLCDRGFCDAAGNPKTKPLWVTLDDAQIVELYNGILWGLLNYYSFVDNYHLLSRVNFILKCSAAKTLAHKHKTSMASIFKKYGGSLKVKVPLTSGRTRTVQFKGETEWRATPTVFKGIGEPDLNLDRALQQSRRLRTRSKLGENCVICGSDDRVQMHHLRHVRKMGTNLKGFSRLMATLNRKQIPVCHECHGKVHRGKYDGMSLKELHNLAAAAR